MSEPVSSESGVLDSPEVFVPIQEIELQGEVRLRTSVSMLYSDILSQELNAAISSPDAVALLQKHLSNKPIDALTQKEIQPLLNSVPDSVLEIAKEAAFTSGAMVKRIPCLMNLKLGERFLFRASGLMAEIELKDGQVTAIRPLPKR